METRTAAFILLAACALLPRPATAFSAEDPDSDGCWQTADGSNLKCCQNMAVLPAECTAAASPAAASSSNGGSSGVIQGAAGARAVGGAGISMGSGGGGSAHAPASAPAAETPAPPSAGAATGDYTALMNREPYVGTKTRPCRWGPTTGKCTYEGGKLIPPPPSPDGFKTVEVGLLPFYPGTNHVILPLSSTKWALHIKGRKFGPFTLHFDSPNGFLPKSALEMFVAISEKPGDFDVPPNCIVTPDMLTNGWAGGAPNSNADIEVSLGKAIDASRCALKDDGRDYYINVAGDCSTYWMKNDPDGLAKARAAGCPSDLVEVNGWMHVLTPGGPKEYCVGKGFGALRDDGLNCKEN